MPIRISRIVPTKTRGGCDPGFLCDTQEPGTRGSGDAGINGGLAGGASTQTKPTWKTDLKKGKKITLNF